ncbi:MAG: associated protein [Firmicutes bacterium]|nr:associated protein [Bacillota bacterium]
MMMKKIIPWLVIVAIGMSIHWVNPAFFPQLMQLIQEGDIEGLAEYLRSFGIWAVAASIFINIIINLLGVVPTALISGANGIIFGLAAGTLLSWVGEVAGTIISFVLWRSLLQETAQKMIARSSYLTMADEFSTSKGFKAVLIARLVPLTPSGIITMLGAISHMPFRDMFWATCIGKAPSIFLEVILGHDIAFASDNKVRLSVLILLVIAIYAYLWWKKRQMQS